MFPVPNSIARLLRFDWYSGFAKICAVGQILGFYTSTTNCPRASLDTTSELRTHEYLRIAQMFETNRMGLVPGTGWKPVKHQQKNTGLASPIYFSEGVASFIPSTHN